ncbi:MAG: CDGSH iron-sulfur domain-containing protein [Candidatus Marinimicrobia bacterium]|nr:CDGSH iron-sulfur domain-containing protein [Candidatus Neomarinimicrobiota bacterium]MCF7827607.1 CDGSH iron-sulfur domain-containing protein [Candidatus Neomarinimicrobiota bacterium]MCF7881532.1 CDGSH iron-sulfur domain-containing protein [Candidatus Neomarinimicrobiota bacterium]
MEIQATKNGPYLVKNAEKVTDHEGNEYEIDDTIALCRCGQSSDKPFCDGTHKDVGFTAEETV